MLRTRTPRGVSRRPCQIPRALCSSTSQDLRAIEPLLIEIPLDAILTLVLPMEVTFIIDIRPAKPDSSGLRQLQATLRNADAEEDKAGSSSLPQIPTRLKTNNLDSLNWNLLETATML